MHDRRKNQCFNLFELTVEGWSQHFVVRGVREHCQCNSSSDQHLHVIHARSSSKNLKGINCRCRHVLFILMKKLHFYSEWFSRMDNHWPFKGFEFFFLMLVYFLLMICNKRINVLCLLSYLLTFMYVTYWHSYIVFQYSFISCLHNL